MFALCLFEEIVKYEGRLKTFAYTFRIRRKKLLSACWASDLSIRFWIAACSWTYHRDLAEISLDLSPRVEKKVTHVFGLIT